MEKIVNTWDQVHNAAEKAAEIVDGHFDEYGYEEMVELQGSLDLPEGITVWLMGGYYDSEEEEYIEPMVVASGWMDHYVDGTFCNVIQTKIPVC